MSKPIKVLYLLGKNFSPDSFHESVKHRAFSEEYSLLISPQKSNRIRLKSRKEMNDYSERQNWFSSESSLIFFGGTSSHQGLEL